MKEINLFRDNDGIWLSNKNLLENLLKIEADKCEILYIHSSLSFGIPNPDIKRSDLLNEIYKVINELNVPTVCMPTFTFSYCNHLIYDKEHSKSRMGVLNEFFRKQEGVLRSNDPLMSVAVKGKDLDLALNISTHSIGDNSTFDMIRHRGDVKFLFLGTRIGDCFTYMHYLEWLYGVPYRYNRRFLGTSIIDNVETHNEFDLFVRHNGVVPNDKSYEYENEMYFQGLAKKITFGNSTISVVDEKEGAAAYKRCLKQNPFYFVELSNGEFLQDKTFVLSKEMVAL